MILSPTAKREIVKLINDLYYTFEAKFLGRFFRGPKLYLELVTDEDITNSIEAIYRFVMADLYGVSAHIDKRQIRRLAEVSRNYIEADRLRTINKVLTEIMGAETADEAKEALGTAFEKVDEYIELLTESESERAIAYSNRDGIQQVAASTGDSDPTVAALGHFSSTTCKYCAAMYHSDHNPLIPKVYKLSEMREGFFKPKLWDGKTPFFPKLHPRCVHSLSYIPRGYGFNESGYITYRGKDWDEYTHQRK